MLKDKGNKDELKLKNIVIKNAVGNPIVRRDLLKLVSVDGERLCIVRRDILKLVSVDSGCPHCHCLYLYGQERSLKSHHRKGIRKAHGD